MQVVKSICLNELIIIVKQLFIHNSGFVKISPVLLIQQEQVHNKHWRVYLNHWCTFIWEFQRKKMLLVTAEYYEVFSSIWVLGFLMRSEIVYLENK